METKTEKRKPKSFYIEKIKSEIIKDIKKGIVPKTIKSFGELGNFVDQNSYGGFCDDNYNPSKLMVFENAVQCAVDDWIKSSQFKSVTLV